MRTTEGEGGPSSKGHRTQHGTPLDERLDERLDEGAPRVPDHSVLLAALDAYRAGAKELHQAAEDAGVESWDLLEAAQATPDPIAKGLTGSGSLEPFVRRRDD